MKLKSLLGDRSLFIILFGAPVLGAALYYGAVAADRYVSESIVTVRDMGSSSGSSSSALGAAAALLGSGGGALSLPDVMYLQSYIHSVDMLKRLDAKLNLRAHYEKPWYDPFYRLWPGTSQEWLQQYFNSRVELTRDDFSGLLTIDVQGFEPAYAQQVAKAILEESETFVNDYSHRIAREKLVFAEKEVAAVFERAKEAKQKLIDFQAKNKLLDPLSQAAANSTLTAQLQAAQAAQETSLKAALDYLSPDSFQVQTLRSQLAATRAQLEAERLRSTTASGGAQLSVLAVEYQGLVTQAGFQDDAYKTALISVEQARLDTLRKIKTVVVVEPPVKPESAIYPARFYNFFTVLALCAMLFSIVRLVVATVREHQD
jgi:capsular polysaccharide transport system permease protein